MKVKISIYATLKNREMKLTIILRQKKTIQIAGATIGILLVFAFVFAYITNTRQQITAFIQGEKQLQEKLNQVSSELGNLKNEDQYKINQGLEEEIKNINTTYQSAVDSYENLLKLKEKTNKTSKLDELFTNILIFLSKRNFATASAVLADLNKQLQAEEDKIAASFEIPKEISVQNEAPGPGYRRQQVETDAGTFLVSIIAADLGSTRVIVDTASDSTCANDCPVLPLSDYVSRNGAFAGINGSYFCPAEYPGCAGKTNSFDTLLMNKNKVYFNSDNNVYSSVPAVIFGSGWIRFVASSSDWGRDTSIDSMIANQGLLVFNSQITFSGDGDPKKGSKGARSFIANKGNTVYIGIVHNATVAESARVMHVLGMDNALNLDDGGSTALWSGSYKVGPGRNLPNVILFVRK